MTRHWWAAVLLVAAACGDGEGDRSSSACGGTDDPTSVAIQWHGGGDPAATSAELARFDDAEPAITVRVRTVDGGPADSAAALLGDDPPTIVQVGVWNIPALVSAGAIAPLDACLASAGFDPAAMVPAAAAKGVVDGARYGVSANLYSAALLYDRAAFRRAGLDPDEPPRTIAEVRAVSMTLRDELGMVQPIDWFPARFTMFGVDPASADGEAVARAWLELWRDDLVYRDPNVSLPSVGSGNAAMELVDPFQLWGYANAIAKGEAPEADLGVAPLPGLREPGAAVEGGIWVVSASATPAEVSAASRLLTWLQRPAAEAVLHIGTDVYPSSLAAADDPAIVEHWRNHPLLRAGWEAMTANPLEHDGDLLTALGAWGVLDLALQDVALGERTFEAAWTEGLGVLRDLQLRADADGAAITRCFADGDADLDTVVADCA